MILVAGGTGHLGVELTRRLVVRGFPVRVMTRNAERARSRLDPRCELAIGDVRRRADVEDALKDVDAVVSALTGFGPGGQGPRAVDRDGNFNLIRAAEAAGVRRFVLVSMQGAAPDHQMELLRMKHAAEERLRSSTLDWTILHPTVFMELWVELVGGPIADRGRAMVFGRGENPINFNSVRDIAEVAELALGEPSLSRSVVPVGGPENLTFNQLVERLAHAMGCRVSVRHVPRPVMRASAVVMRYFKPDVAGMIEAGIAMDTAAMSFNAGGLRERFPALELTWLDDVIEQYVARLPGAAAGAARRPTSAPTQGNC